MSDLPKTGEALSALMANSHLGGGEHIHPRMKAGSGGLLIGYEMFDANKHNASQIDHLAPDAEAFEEDQVPVALPYKPLSLSIVTHYPRVIEHPAVIVAKRALTGELMASIEDAIPGMRDRSYLYAIGGDIPEQQNMDVEVIPEDNEKKVAVEIAEIAARGLTFVISDYNTLKLREAYSILAIKVNDQFERFVPDGFRPKRIKVSHPGQPTREVSVRKREEKASLNTELERVHIDKVNELELAGAAVASVIARPENGQLFNWQVTDIEIASALDQLANRYQAAV